MSIKGVATHENIFLITHTKYFRPLINLFANNAFVQ